MASWFSPKVQAPPTPGAAEPPPSRTDPAVIQSEQRDRVRRKLGRVATMLSGAGGDTSAPQVGVKTLLGA